MSIRPPVFVSASFSVQGAGYMQEEAGNWRQIDDNVVTCCRVYNKTLPADRGRKSRERGLRDEKSLLTPRLQQSIRCFQKVHPQRPLNHHSMKKSTFFWRGHGQKYRSECTKTHHFRWKIQFFFQGGPSALPKFLPGGEGILYPTLHQTFWIRPCVVPPQN